MMQNWTITVKIKEQYVRQKMTLSWDMQLILHHPHVDLLSVNGTNNTFTCTSSPSSSATSASSSFLASAGEKQRIKNSLHMYQPKKLLNTRCYNKPSDCRVSSSVTFICQDVLVFEPEFVLWHQLIHNIRIHSGFSNNSTWC